MSHGNIALDRLALFFSVVVVSIVGAAGQAFAQLPSEAPFNATELKQFTSLDPVDIHTHVLKSDPAFTAMLERLNLRLLNIFVGDPTTGVTRQSFESLKEASWQAVDASGGRVKLSTTFDPLDWRQPLFPRPAIYSINRDFTRGAVAMTIWSNGLSQFKDRSGRFFASDSPVLDPIYKDVTTCNKTFIAHIGGPEEQWVPDPAAQTAVSAVLAARDNVISQNPSLRVVGAHLGSAKEDLDELAARLDRYPNLAVDTSGRIDYLMTQPRDRVIAFLTKYQDRILYGTDLGFRSTENMDDLVKAWEIRYATEWRLLATGDTLEYHSHQVRGLNLSQSIVRKIYHDNAVHWVPGIVP